MSDKENNKVLPGSPAASTGFTNFWAGRYPLWLYAFIPCLLTFLFYLPILKNGFVGWDDPDIITNNTHIRSLDFASLRWVFSNFHAGYWVPMTWLSYTLNFLVGRLDPGLYHFTNLLLHLLNTALVFQVCRLILRAAEARPDTHGAFGKKIPIIPAAFMTAILFGLHPIQVESVAWAAERKGILCAFFYLLALLSYLSYSSSREVKAAKYFACLGFFLLALMSKPMAVTLPLVLLILDGWPFGILLKNPLKAIAEKAPFFALALIDGLMTAHFYNQVNVFQLMNKAPLLFKVITPFYSLGFYLWKMTLPLDLVPLYPLPLAKTGTFYAEGFGAAVVVALISLGCFLFRKKRPYLAAAGLYYLATLGPVLGILELGYHAAADRYVYLPCLGFFFVLSAWFSVLVQKRPTAGFWLFAGMAAVLGFLTVHQLGVWNNSLTLWEKVVQNYPDDSPSFVHSNLGAAYQLAGRKDDAMREYDAGISAPPPWPSAHNGKGTLLFDMGKKEQAIQEFKTALSLDPRYLAARKNLAMAYQKMGREDEAEAERKELLRIDQEGNGP